MAPSNRTYGPKDQRATTEHSFPTPNPPVGHVDPLLYEMLVQQGNQLAEMRAQLVGFKEAITDQKPQLAKIDDIRVDVGTLKSETGNAKSNTETLTRKVESLQRMVLLGAGAVALIAMFGPTIVARILPSPPSAQQAQSSVPQNQMQPTPK